MDPLPRRRKEGGGETVEVYGFAGWIASLVAYALYLIWAYVPESTLHTLGITYYPSKYWAIAVPCAVIVTVTTAVVVYIAVNFISTAPLDSFDTITDIHARPVVDRSSVWEEDGPPNSTSRVPDIGDLDMSTVNRLLYKDTSAQATSGYQRRRRDRTTTAPTRERTISEQKLQDLSRRGTFTVEGHGTGLADLLN